MQRGLLQSRNRKIAVTGGMPAPSRESGQFGAPRPGQGEHESRFVWKSRAGVLDVSFESLPIGRAAEQRDRGPMPEAFCISPPIAFPNQRAGPFQHRLTLSPPLVRAALVGYFERDCRGDGSPAVSVHGIDEINPLTRFAGKFLPKTSQVED
jgi:hypothetical protein